MSEQQHKQFDKFIKEQMDNYELPFDASAWNNVQQKIGTSTMLWSRVSTKLFSAAVIIGAVAISSIWFFNNSNDAQQITETKPQEKVEQNLDSKEITNPDKEQSVQQTENNEVIPEKPVIEKKKEIVKKSQLVITESENAKEENIKPEALNSLAQNEAQEIEKMLNIVSNSNNICAFETIEFKPTDSMAFRTITWDFGDGDLGKNFRVKHQFKSPGSFDVKLVAIDLKGKTYEANTTILVNPKPNADFDYETTDFQCHNSSICFRTNNTFKTRWNFGDSRTSFDPNPKHTYFRKGHYNVKLTVENEYGCKDSTQKQVYVMRAYNLLAPNTFSPNGDGKNDTWMPIALQNGDKEFELRIIDASGRTVFTSKNGNNVWDGNLGNGTAKAGDMFFWVAVVTDSTGTPNEYGGSILIAP